MILGFLKSLKVRINRNVNVLVDTEFQSINKFHKNLKIPKKYFLTKSDKSNNHKILRKRVLN